VLRRPDADRAGLFAGLVPTGALLTTVVLVLGLGRAGPADVPGTPLVTVRGGVTSPFRHNTVSSPEASPDGIREGVAHAPLTGVVVGAVDARPVAEQAVSRMYRKPVFR
jgi:hypothetical protein